MARLNGVLLIAGVTIALLSAGCGGGGGADTASTQLRNPSAVGPAGGQVTSSTGDTAGASVSVPAGALATNATLTIASGAAILFGGTAPVGPAIQLGPSGLQFQVPATVTLPFSSVGMPGGATVGDVRVLRREDATGIVGLLAPSAVDPVAGHVLVATSGFSTFQAVVRLPVIGVSTPALAFGTVTVGAAVLQSFSVENTGGGALSGSASAAPPFTVVSGASYALTAGQSQRVDVRFDPATPGAATGTATCTGAGGAAVTLTGTGVSPPALAVAPPTLALGVVTLGASIDDSFTVANSGGGLLSGTATASSPFAIVGGGTYSLGAGQSQAVTVRFSPAAPGPATGTATCTGGTGGAVALSGAGVLPPTLTSSATVLDFGQVLTNETRDLSITVTNAGSGTISGRITAAGQFAVISGATYVLGGGATTAVTVRFTPEPLGPATATIAGPGAGGLLLPARAEVVQPPFALQSAVEFGAIPLGSFIDRTVTLCNPPAAGISVTPTAGAPFAIVGQSPIGIGGAQTAPLVIRFAPTAPGLVTGTVSIAGVGSIEVGGCGGAPLRPPVTLALPGGLDLAAGRLDGDLIDDLALAQAANPLLLLAGSPSGSPSLLGSPAAGGDPDRVATADLDRDGFVDIVCLDRSLATVTILWGDATGGFASSNTLDLAAMGAGGGTADAVAIGDLSPKDGYDDLVIARETSNEVTLLMSSGRRSYVFNRAFAATAPTDVAIGDIDGSGFNAIVFVSPTTGKISAFGRTNMDEYLPATGRGRPTRVAVARLLGRSGHEIVALEADGPALTLWRGFVPGIALSHLGTIPIGATATSFAPVDLDGDAWLDIAVAHESEPTVTVLRNLGGGSFAAMPSEPVGIARSRIAPGDMDGDLRTDLAVLCDNAGGADLSILGGVTAGEPRFELAGRTVTAAGGVVVFMIDLSTSMTLDPQPFVDRFGNPQLGSRFERVKDALLRAVERLPSSLRFNICSFECTPTWWSDDLRAAEPIARASAMAWIQQVRPPSFAPSGIRETIREIASRHPDCRAIALLSDGTPSCAPYTTAMDVDTVNGRRIVIHCLAVSTIGLKFMREVARRSGGRCIEIP